MVTPLIDPEVLVVVALSTVLVPLYLAPTVVAWDRRRQRLLWIGVVNVVFGWTIVGWVFCLVWALTRE